MNEALTSFPQWIRKTLHSQNQHHTLYVKKPAHLDDQLDLALGKQFISKENVFQKEQNFTWIMRCFPVYICVLIKLPGFYDQKRGQEKLRKYVGPGGTKACQEVEACTGSFGEFSYHLNTNDRFINSNLRSHP